MYTEPPEPIKQKPRRRLGLTTKLTVPILLPAAILALVLVSAWVARNSEMALAVAGLLVLMLAAGSLFLFFVDRYVMRPLRQLRDGVARLGAGELGYHVEVRTGDELEEVAAEFNRMSANLKSLQDEVLASAEDKERLATEAQARLREVSSLLEAGRAITSLDLESVLGVLAREAAASVRAEECAIYLLRSGERELTARGVWSAGDHAVSKRAAVMIGDGPVGWVAEHGQPLLLSGAQVRTRFGLGAGTGPLGSLAALPLFVDGQVAGVLHVTGRGMEGFKPGDERLLAAFVDQAAVAVKNAQLFEEERRRARELAVINQINRRISGSLDVEHTLKALLSALGDLIPHDLAQICLWEPEHNLLRTRARNGDPRYVAGSSEYAPDEGLPGRLYRGRAAIVVPDVREDPLLLVEHDRAQFPVRAVIGVLLTAGQDVIGTLELASYRPQAFTTRHLTTLETLAGQAAVAIQNARLFADGQRRLRELSGLHEISQAVGALSNPQEVYGQLTERIARLMDVEVCGVLLYDAPGQQLVAQTPFYGMPEQLVSIYRLSVGPDAVLYSMWKDGGPWIFNDVQEDELVAAAGLRDLALAAATRATVLVTMKVGNRAVGVIQASNKTNGAEFTADDARLLGLFAAQAAALIENAALFSQVRRRAEETYGLYRIATLSSSTLDLNELLKQVMAETCQLLNAQVGLMLLWDTQHHDLIVQQSALYGVRPEDVPSLVLSGDEAEFQYVITNTRRVFISDNVETDKRILPGYRRLAERLAVHNVIGVPLLTGEQALGEILLCNRPGGFGEDEARLLGTLTSQFALAIERAQLFTVTQRRVTELEVLRQMSQALSSTLDLEQLLEALYEQIRRVMFTDNYYVALYDQTEDRIDFAFYMSRGQRRRDVSGRRGGNGLTEYIVRSRDPLMLRGDVAGQARELGVDPVGPDSRVWLGVPMMSGERVLGVLSVQSYEDEHQFDEGHLRLLQAVAAQAAIGIENARLYRLTDANLRQRVDQLTALTRIGRELNATLDRSHIMELVLDELLRTTGASCGSISLRDLESQVFNVLLSKGCPLDTASDADSDRRATETGRPQLVPDYHAAGHHAPHEHVAGGLTVPIRYEQSVIGLVHLHSAEVDHFDREAIDFVEAVAAQAAIAAGNAQRYNEMLERGEQLRRRVEQSARLFQISQAFRSDRPLFETIEETAYAVQETIGFAVVVISLLEKDPDGVQYLRRVVGAGVPLRLWEQVRDVRQPWSAFNTLLSDEFRISQSYYVPFEAHPAQELAEGLDAHVVGDPQAARVPGRWHPEDVLLTPLRGSGGRYLGAISVDGPPEGAVPTRATIEALETFANQIAAVIENTRLFEELQAQHAATVAERDRLARLHLATLEVQRSDTLRDKLNAIAAGIHAAGWNRVLITLRDEQLEPLEMITAGFAPEEVEQLQAHLSPGQVWRARFADPDFSRYRLGMAYFLPADDPAALTAFGALGFPSQQPRGEGPNAWDPNDAIFLPLYGPSNQVIGIISLDEPSDRRRPTEASLQPIELFAQQAAYAIGSARLVQSVIDLKEFNESIVHSIQQGICVLDREARIISVNAYMNAMYGWSGDVIGQNIFEFRPAFAEIGLREGFDHIIATGQPVTRAGVRNTDRHGNLLVRNFYGYPLRSGEQVTGVVILVEDVTEKARLEESDRRRAALVALIGDIGRQMSSLLSLDAIFTALVESVQQAFQHRNTLLLVLDEQSDDTLTVRAAAGAAAGDDSLRTLRIPLLRGVIGRAARTGVTQLVQDTSQDPDYFTQGAAVAAAELAVPIKLGGRVLGVLNLDAVKPQAFDEGDVVALETLADQAAVAIQNARLFEETTLRARQLAAIQSVTATVNAGTGLHSVLPAVLPPLRELAPVDALTVWLLRSESLALYGLSVSTAAFNRVKRAEQVYRTDSTIGWAIDNRQPLLLARLAAERNTYADVPELLDGGMQCYVVLPLMLGERVIGAVTLGSKRAGAFGPRELQPFAQLAGQLASAAERSRLFEETDRRLRQQTVLYEASAAAASSLNAQLIRQNITEQMARLVGATSNCYYTWHEEEGLFEMLNEYWAPDAVAAERESLVGQTWAVINSPDMERAVREGTPQLVRVSNPQLAPAERRDLERHAGKSAFYVPLVVRGHTVGCFEVWNSREEYLYSEEEQRLLQALAVQAGVAIENARLFEETEERVRELAAITRFGEAISSTVLLDELFAIVGRELSAIFETDSYYVGLYDAEHNVIDFPLLVDQGVASQVAPIPSDRGLSSTIVRTREPLLIRTRAELETLPSGYVGTPAEAYLGVPMTAGDVLAGVVAVQSYTRENAFGVSHQRILMAIASQLAVAIANARSYAEEQKRRRLAEALRQAAETVSSTLDVGEVLERLLTHLARVVPYDTASIQLLRGDTFEIIGGRGFPDLGVVLGLRFPAGGDNPNTAVLERRAPVLYDDVRPLFPHMATPPHDHIRAWLGVPLLYGDDLLGMIAIDSRVPGAFTLEAAEQALAFANQAAVALQNARLYQETADREQFAEALGRVALAVNSTLDLPTVLDLICQETLLIFGVDSAVVWLQQGEQLEAIAAQGEWRTMFQGMRLPAGDPRLLSARVIEERRPLFINFVGAADEPVQELPEGLGVQAVLAVPLLGQQSVGALILLDARRPDHFTASDVEKAAVIGTQGAIAIENARLFANANKSAEQLSTLNEIARVVSGGLQLGTILESIYQQMQRVIPLDAFYVALYDPATDRMSYPLMYDEGERYHEEPSALMHGGVSYRTMQERRPVIVQRTQEELDHIIKQSADQRLGNRGRSSASLIYAPLIVGAEVLGVISVQSYTLNAYTPEHLTLLGGIANHAAVAIRNARLFEQVQEQSTALQRRVDELAVFNELGQVISATLDIDALMRALHYQVGRLIDTSNFYVALYDAERDETVFPYAIEHGALTQLATRPLSGLTGQIVRSREPLLIRTVAERRALSVPLVGEPAQCYLGVPLIYGDEVIGVIAVQSYTAEHAYGDDDLRLLTAIAHQAAVAIQNARLFEQIRRFTQELEQRVQERTEELARANRELLLERDRIDTLFRITSELASSLDLDRVLLRALQLIVEAVGATQGMVLLLDHETDTLWYRAALGRAAPLPPGGQPTPFKRGEGLGGWVMRHREPVILSDIYEDPRWTSLQSSSSNYRSVLCVPLGAEEPLGVIMLAHPQVDYFTESELRLVAAAASQVAAAISNAELYGLIREQAERLGSTLRSQQTEAAKSQAILEGVADGVMVTDAHGSIQLFNAAAQRVLGLSRNKVLGRQAGELIGIYGRAGRTLNEAIERWRLHPSSYTGEFLAERLELERRIVLVHIAPVLLGEEYLGTVSVFRDITKEVEVDRMKSEFVSTVSHELRTPMTSIKGYADLLLLGAAGAVSDTQRRFLDVIKSNADRLSALVNDLLDISRIETGRVELDRKAVRLQEVAAQVIANLRGRSRQEEKEMEVVSDVPPEVPQVFADHDRVTQILTNLVDNAFNYTPVGGTITVQARVLDDDRVRVSVQDTGIGIPPEDVEKIFDRFFRGDDPAVQVVSGTGLGLAIVSSLVQMHGGTLSVESPGHGLGSTFSFTLPLYHEDAEGDAVSEPAASAR
jgi:PAS domain S-box-containing protein